MTSQTILPRATAYTIPQNVLAFHRFRPTGNAQSFPGAYRMAELNPKTTEARFLKDCAISDTIILASSGFVATRDKVEMHDTCSREQA
jgi:hypothetical protein